MLDINDILEALKTRVEQFPDRSAKWLLENTENLRGLLEIIASDIVECLDFSKVEIKSTTLSLTTCGNKSLTWFIFYPSETRITPGRHRRCWSIFSWSINPQWIGRWGSVCCFICVRYGTANAGSGDFNRSSRSFFIPVIRNGRRFLRWRR